MAKSKRRIFLRRFALEWLVWYFSIMQIDIQLLPFPPDPQILSGRSVVVIDVLRATSVIVHAMSEGALEIIPVATVEEAFQMARTFPPSTTLLGGERGSQKIPGFDLGNSPREYVAEKVKGKRLILTTTNGTKAFHFVSSGKEIMVGSFFNIGATAQRCFELDRDLLLFLSGDEGNFSLEDTVCGGMLIDLVIKKGRNRVSLTDASHAAHMLYQRFEANLLEAFQLSRHGKELVDSGAGDDLPYCTQIDIIPLVPIFREEVIRTNWKVEGGRQKAKSKKAVSRKQEAGTRNLKPEI
jgi:2-phosphosulfolactate phosphatase